jgi:hypothetical protein
MTGKFYADGMAVRFADGKPCCVTSGSTHLDADESGATQSRRMRKGMAHIIAQALNQYFEVRKAGA